jgi:hypothetical protein
MMTGRMDYNLVYNVKNQDECPIGPHDLCGDPLFANASIDSFDGRLLNGSPALDTGLASGALIPADALEGNGRPFGSGVDRGAYERADGPVADLRVNGAGATASATSGSRIPIEVALSAQSRTGEAADLWLVTATPSGRSSFDAASWQWVPGLSSGYQGGLADLEFGQLSIEFTPMQAGSYTVYFGVDMRANGYLDLEQSYYRAVELTVTE